MHSEDAGRAAPAVAGGGPRIEQLPGRLNLAHTQNPTPGQAVALRDYQLDGVARIRHAYASGRRRVLYVAPTGSGKRVVFTHIVRSALARGKRVLLLVHRTELLEQAVAELELCGIGYGISGVPESEAPVQVAMVSTLARRLQALARQGRLCDCRRSSPYYRQLSWARVLASQPQAWILGASTTPQRLDARGLGELFDDMVVGPSTAELIEAGWLSRFIVFEPSAPDLSSARIRAGDYAVEDFRAAMSGVVIGAAVAEYQRICPGVPAVVFCVDVAHSEAVADRFREAGVRAQHIDGETPGADRRAAIAALGSGDLDVITNCGLISEGVDVPNIGAAILLRPTASLRSTFSKSGGRCARCMASARLFSISQATRHATACPTRPGNGRWTPNRVACATMHRMARDLGAAAFVARSISPRRIDALSVVPIFARRRNAPRSKCASARRRAASRRTCSRGCGAASNGRGPARTRIGCASSPASMDTGRAGSTIG